MLPKVESQPLPSSSHNIRSSSSDGTSLGSAESGDETGCSMNGRLSRRGDACMESESSRRMKESSVDALSTKLPDWANVPIPHTTDRVVAGQRLIFPGSQWRAGRGDWTGPSSMPLRWPLGRTTCATRACLLGWHPAVKQPRLRNGPGTAWPYS